MYLTPLRPLLMSPPCLLVPTEPTCFPLLSLEDEGIVTTSSSAASTPHSHNSSMQELEVSCSELRLQVQGTDA